MSKDMLGAVMRAAVGVPQDRLETLAKIASAMAGDNPKGEEWYAHFRKELESGLPETTIAFERNEYGHVVLTVIGLDLTGAQEAGRLKGSGYRVGDYAESMLTSTKADSYDANHRLVAGQTYKIVLVPGREIQNDSERTTANLQKLGGKYGYSKPLAGITPRIREAVSDEQMEKIGIWYIAVLHDPITDSDGDPLVLRAHRDGDGRWLLSYWPHPDSQWRGCGAFAFVLPQV